MAVTSTKMCPFCRYSTLFALLLPSITSSYHVTSSLVLLR